MAAVTPLGITLFAISDNASRLLPSHNRHTTEIQNPMTRDKQHVPHIIGWPLNEAVFHPIKGSGGLHISTDTLRRKRASRPVSEHSGCPRTMSAIRLAHTTAIFEDHHYYYSTFWTYMLGVTIHLKQPTTQNPPPDGHIHNPALRYNAPKLIHSY